MSTADDPEQLLAEALRAQAARAPGQVSAPEPPLLSGVEHGLPIPVEPLPPTLIAQPAARQFGAPLILVMALLLGLLCGAVAAVLTML